MPVYYKAPYERKKIMTIEKIKAVADKVNYATHKAPVQADAFMALIEKIKQARQDIKAIKGYVSTALGLALCDFFCDNNKNSLKVLASTPVDYNKTGKGIPCINLYNMRAFLDSLGISLAYNVDSGALSVRADLATFKAPPSNRADFMQWYNSNPLQDFKKPVAKSTLSNYDRIKQIIGKLSDDEKAKIKALIGG